MDFSEVEWRERIGEDWSGMEQSGESRAGNSKQVLLGWVVESRVKVQNDFRVF